jgi:hypothetical protein
LNIKQARKVFKDSIGDDLPKTFSIVGAAIKWMSKEMGTMFQWFKDVGYSVDIPALRTEEPQLQDFSQWLKETSGFRKE